MNEIQKKKNTKTRYKLKIWKRKTGKHQDNKIYDEYKKKK